MPAPNIATCFQFEELVEPKLKDACVTAGLDTARIFIARSALEITTPCLLLRLTVGSSPGHKFPPPTLSYYVDDWRNVTIEGEVRTNRGLNEALHTTYRSLFRQVMANVFATLNPILLYHAIAETPNETGFSDVMADDAHNHDVSTISFSGVLAIKSTAWPPQLPLTVDTEISIDTPDIMVDDTVYNP